MAIPTQNFTILSNGLGTGGTATAPIVVIAPKNALTTAVGEVVAVSNPVKAKELFGYSPAAEATGLISQLTGMCYAIEVPAIRTQIVAQSMTKVGTGTGTITVDGYADFDFDFKVKVVTPNTFQFSLDGYTYGETRALVVGAFVVPNSGLTITFGGTFVAGDIYSYTCSGPGINTTYLGAAFAKIKDYPSRFKNILVYDGLQTSSTSSTLFGLVKSEMTSLANNYKWSRAIMEFGSLDPVATTITALGTVSSDQISVVTDSAQVSSALTREGWSIPKLGLVLPYAARAAGCLISEDPGQVNRGSLAGVFNLQNDEKSNPTGLDAAKAVTGMKHPGLSGFYVTNSHLKSAVGSDFKYIQHGTVIDEACSVVYANQATFLKAPVRVMSGGTIDARDAARYEGIVNNALDDALKAPVNSAGTTGHVSAVAYQVDRTNNVLTSETLITTVYVLSLIHI